MPENTEAMNAWETQSAIEVVFTVLCEELPEEQLNDDQCLALAKKIVAHLEEVYLEAPK